MTPWKMILMIVVLLIPGGSLVVLAMAAAKAFHAGRDRLFRRGGMGAIAGPMAVPVPMTLGAGHGVVEG